jgi:hypothetical protein
MAMLKQTGCDFVMIGTAAFINPMNFHHTHRYLKTGMLPSNRATLVLQQFFRNYWRTARQVDGYGPRKFLKRSCGIYTAHPGWNHHPAVGELVFKIGRREGMTNTVKEKNHRLAQTAEFLLSHQVITYVMLFSFDPMVVDHLVGRTNAYRWGDYNYLYKGEAKSVQISEGVKCLLEACQDCRQPALVKFEALITKINSATLPQIARFCQELGVGFYLEPPVRTIRALDYSNQLVLDPQGYQVLYERLMAIQGLESLEAARIGSCPVEKNPEILTNGDIGFCSCRPARVGNVGDGSLRRLYRQAKGLKRKEDRSLPEIAEDGRFFRRCWARKFYETRHRLHCNY